MQNSIKYRKFILPLVIGILIWLLTPFKPDSLSIQAWYMFAIFVATIIACITQPMAMGAVSILGFTVMVITGVSHIKNAVPGSGNNSTWLIVIAFFISCGLLQTRLGR